MPLGAPSSPLIGASLVQVWKPQAAVGVASDATAPFALGTKVDCVPGATGGRNVAVFCRVAAAGINAAATAGITNGVTVTAAAGNTFTNDTGVALIVGDYAFLTTAGVSTP